MRKLLNYFLLLLAGYSIAIYAGTIPVMRLVPDFHTIALATTGQAGFTYTVTNDTSSSKQPEVLNNITVNSVFGITDKNIQSAIQTENNTCQNISLAPGQSCTFEIFLIGSANL